MKILQQKIQDKFINKNGKITPWIGKADWIKKNGLEGLIDEIHNMVPDDISLRDKIVVITRYDGIIPTCQECGTKTNYHASIKKFADYCSKECSDRSPIKSELARQRIQPEKLKKAFQEKYGVAHTHQVPEIVEKMKKTVLERYGVDNVSKADHIKKKISEKTTGVPKTGNPSGYRASMTEEQLALLDDLWETKRLYEETETPITLFARQNGLSGSTLYNAFRRNSIPITKFTKTYPEKLVEDFLKSIGVEFLVNDRKQIGPYELDFYIPSHQLAIEVNGLFWHHDGRHHRNHLLEKTNRCAENGITLLHFFDNEITEKSDICFSIIKNKLGITSHKIPARKTSVDGISSAQHSDFCEKNHIQGSRNASMRHGLFFDGELISIMSFNKTGEMVRFCNKLDHTVIGGAGKLLKSFDLNMPIFSFADKRFFDGGLYINLGFELEHETSPNYWYFHNRKYVLESRLKYQKHKLPKLLENFDPNISEHQNMLNHGYLRIFDCGNRKFVLNTSGGAP